MDNMIQTLKLAIGNNILDNVWIRYAWILGTTYVIIRFGQYVNTKIVLSNKRKHKRTERTSQLEKLQETLKSVDENKVTEIFKLSTEDVITSIKAGRYTCSEVLQVFQFKALQAHEKTNCLVQPISEAKDAATDLESKDDKNSPLFGLPVSIKDNFCYKGYDSTVGCSNWIGKPFPDDCVLVKVLKHQGAIPYVKTNVPQTMLSWETSNPIYGITTHPLDKTRGVGGSSGGEAALIGAGGSMLGFGGDIGGSIRIPAAICGVTGLKPTFNRISSSGTFPMLKGQLACRSCMGPMGKDVDTIVLAMRALCVPIMWELDPTVPRMPFNEEIYNSKRALKIGYYLNDGFMESVPAMRRGVMEATQILEKQGHSVTEWKIPAEAFSEIIPLWAKLVFGDQGYGMIRLLKNDSYDPSIKFVMFTLKMPIIVKKLVSFILKPFIPVVSKMAHSISGCGSVSEWWDLNERVSQLKVQIMDDWKSNGFDAVICPGFTCPATPLGVPGKVGSAVSYTSIYNTLDFAAGSVPVSVVSANDEEQMKHYIIKDPWHRVVKNAMKGSTGLPVNVQVVTLPWQEETCLRVMKNIETGVKDQNAV